MESGIGTVEHPYLTLIRNLGCLNETRIMMAFQSYLELTEVYVDIHCHYKEDVDLIYFTCKQTSDSQEKIYIPIEAEFRLSPEWLNNIRMQFLSAAGGNGVILIIRDRDSSNMQYKIKFGLEPPLPSPSEISPLSSIMKAGPNSKVYRQHIKEIKKLHNEILGDKVIDQLNVPRQLYDGEKMNNSDDSMELGELDTKMKRDQPNDNEKTDQLAASHKPNYPHQDS